jgi:hypothetical protein
MAGPDVVHEEFDGEIVVLNLQSGQYFGLNGSAAALWLAIVAGADPTAIAGDMGTGFAARLVELSLIKANDGAPTPADNLNFTDPPTIEIYDDLSDLILADPIHDVDEDKGWPILPDNA